VLRRRHGAAYPTPGHRQQPHELTALAAVVLTVPVLLLGSLALRLGCRQGGRQVGEGA